MIGDQQDMASRMKAVLPARWFPDTTPILDGLLNGMASAWAWTHGLLGYVRLQTRIATATDVWLDIVAQDFFGARLLRNGQSDDALRRRIEIEILRERGTRAGIVSILFDLTGRPPVVFEPGRPTDTGGYGKFGAAATGLAYGRAGGWGSLALPHQCFVTAYRPLTTGIANVAGWGNSAGGYRAGAIEYASLAAAQAQLTDADIYAAIAGVMPVAAIAWTHISN